MNHKTCIIIVGPTAVGKTDITVSLAQLFHSKIISADSRQCYKEINIGVAKPSQLQLQTVPHLFINSHTIHEVINAKLFETYALNKCKEIFSTEDIVFLAGGTGLYIKAFCEGLDEIPEVNITIQNELNDQYKKFGLEWLKKKLSENDKKFFFHGEIHNPHRSLRALAVKLSTGKSILDFHSREKKKRNFKIIKVGLELPRNQLYQNINNRVDVMLKQGLLDEVESLKQFYYLQALQTVGYKELFDHLNGKISLEKAIDTIKINTRQYAKRQMTWFKKDEEIKWFEAGKAKDAIISLIEASV